MISDSDIFFSAMTSAPRYAFICLEGNLSRRELHAKLDELGETTLMYRLSEALHLFTKMFSEIEIQASQASSLGLLKGAPAIEQIDVAPTMVTPPLMNQLLKRAMLRDPSVEDQERSSKSLSSTPIITEGLINEDENGTSSNFASRLFGNVDVKEEPEDSEGYGGIDAEENSLSDIMDDDEQNGEGDNDGAAIDEKDIVPDQHGEGSSYAKTRTFCHICRKWILKTNSKNRLNAHIVMHMKAKQYHCPYPKCNYSNRSLRVAQHHMKSVHEDRITPLVNVLRLTDERFLTQMRAFHRERDVMLKKGFPGHYKTPADLPSTSKAFREKPKVDPQIAVMALLKAQADMAEATEMMKRIKRSD